MERGDVGLEPWVISTRLTKNISNLENTDLIQYFKKNLYIR